MPWKVGKRTTKGWPILKRENGKWVIVGYSESKSKAKASVSARYAAKLS